MAVVAALGPLLSVASSVMGAMGAMAQANSQAAQLEAEAIRKEQQAGQERAASQHKAVQKTKESDRLISQQNASFAASGGGVVGSAVDVMGETALQGKMNSETALYEGEARARSAEDDAAIKRAAASSAKSAGQMSAATGLLGGLAGFAKQGGGFGATFGYGTDAGFRYQNKMG